ncbi:hypothetical protein N7509_012930 [Penicillium cosmopolitanum]|uniref:MARVEL domain-containing protein n=1 Tax=Penicillium cosmopolitanum TaxID=1131564 RepID=A0A9W9VCU4_9EURO|nr:uncharacterized protein N7509_012930 [Penicillium cosmopolitanum]KAJ5376044.1 hypothetical protein N7509_012930 [Penicillium cosmopolitanum]
MIFSTAIARPVQLATRTLQWSSAVIVMGLTSFFISRGPHGQHLLYQEVISVLSVVFFIPAFISPFLPTALSKFVLLIDVIFSYLWLTAFIFAAQDYNQHSCYLSSPPGVTCGRKKANESFIFLAFIFTFFGMFLQVAALWAYRKGNAPAPVVQEKDDGTRAPLDAPVGPAPAAVV